MLPSGSRIRIAPLIHKKKDEGGFRVYLRTPEGRGKEKHAVQVCL